MYPPSRDTVGCLIVGVLVVLAVVGIASLAFHYFDTWNLFLRGAKESFLERGFFPNGWNLLKATPWFYAVTAIASIIMIFVAANFDKLVAMLVAGALVLVSGAYLIPATWDNDKDAARSYAHATTFVIEDAESIPSSLEPLAEGARSSDDCDLVGSHDVASCIIEGELPSSWERRVASATAAEIKMSRTSGSSQNTSLMTNTLAYLHGEEGTGAWTAIRNGVNRQPIHGVVSWDGESDPETCRFTGDYALEMAFDGNWGRNLHDEVAKQYRNFLYEEGDMWGYCDADEPVIVIPVYKQEGYAHRTTARPAGVLTIQGSASGQPVIEHVAEVAAGDFPGPVYAMSLVAQQRDLVQWAAGRMNKNRYNFGFESTDVRSQAGNSGEYLLRSEDDGRLYWVTPMKPRATDSQLLVAYSVTRADEVQSGELNEQYVHVLGDEDTRIVNVDDMEARVNQALRESDPGFFTGEPSGKITEFLPVSQDTWQAYAELSGRVVYRIDVPADASIQPSVFALDDSDPEVEVEITEGAPESSESSDAPDESGGSCATSPSEMSDAELAECIRQWAEELAGR